MAEGQACSARGDYGAAPASGLDSTSTGSAGIGSELHERTTWATMSSAVKATVPAQGLSERTETPTRKSMGG